MSNVTHDVLITKLEYMHEDIKELKDDMKRINGCVKSNEKAIASNEIRIDNLENKKGRWSLSLFGR